MHFFCFGKYMRFLLCKDSPSNYTHKIINLSDTENLVTVMYCNEIFDPGRPDAFFEVV